MKFIDFSKKLFFITGASSGIGAATALLLDHLGAKLILVGRQAEKLNVVNGKSQQKNHLILEKDITDWRNIKKDFKNICEQHGPLDGMVHCAGMHMIKPFKLISEQNMDEIFSLNIKSAFHLIQAFRQNNCHTKDASVVLLSSVMSQVGQIGVSLYAASKGSIEALTKSLALELASENIRVNCILPGIVKTKMTESLFAKLDDEQIEKMKAMHPLGLGEPEDIANGIAFLLSKKSRWMTGTSMIMDGGYLAH